MKPEHRQGHFDRWASRYDRSIHQKLMFGPVHEAVLGAFSTFGAVPREILDVGCGTGRLLEAAGRRWREARLTGIDASEPMIAEARRKHGGDPRFTLEQGDASALPLGKASFDVVFSTMSFHHWGDQVLGIREVARVLRPGGLFVLADVSMPLFPLLRPLFSRGDGSTFQRPLAVRRLLEQAALSVIMQRRFWRLSRVQLFVARKS
jgi:ubiquinone/menaquinone biosynthesis C-methylase UbiE